MLNLLSKFTNKSIAAKKEFASQRKIEDLEHEKIMLENSKNELKTKLEEKQEYYDAIMYILTCNNEDKIKHTLNLHGFKESDLFSINSSENGKYDVTLGFNTFGEDVCSRDMDTHLDALKFSAVRTLLGYDIKSY
ncbi:hypothetical protein ACFHWD_12540 [Clostridium sp. MT-14]|jgi:hypothetical protein|uniref:Uncharacterized protein n=1 Tax=Clostridium aromativorans TaxID=2836848 RepID=A0ABS8N8B7_9CLOT|nr:hypothetical protein [Clostridium aromativorans]MCC9296040.1 hypothetical protein [Clostridium aromativorans]CAB1248887.1 hypothetical protein CLOSBL3_11793 [Clostridiaceae bacterium BL-3]